MKTKTIGQLGNTTKDNLIHIIIELQHEILYFEKRIEKILYKDRPRLYSISRVEETK